MQLSSDASRLRGDLGLWLAGLAGGGLRVRVRLGDTAVEKDGEKEGEAGRVLERLLVTHRLEMDLLERWWAALGELEWAAARLAKLAATNQRQVSRFLNGMTPRQRAFIAHHPSLSWRSTHGKEWRAAVRRRQVFAARQPALRRLEAEWVPRLAEAQAHLDAARWALGQLAGEVLVAWPIRPERFTCRTRTQLQHLAKQAS